MTTAQFSDAEKRVTLWGVAIVFLLSALDQWIVATAMPRIIAAVTKRSRAFVWGAKVERGPE